MIEKRFELPPVSLAMIVRNSAPELERCLASIAPHVQDITVVDTEPNGSTDGTGDVVRKHGGRLFHRPWDDNFAVARNFSFEKALHNHVLWLDSDDIVIGAEQWLEDIRMAIHAGYNTIKARYDYEFDERGKCTNRLMRERVVDRRVYEWRSDIHECLCATFMQTMATVKITSYVEHQRFKGVADPEEKTRHTERNLKIMEKMEKEGRLETRTLHYYGNTLMGLKRYDEAIVKYLDYVKRGGVPEETYASLRFAAACHVGMERVNDARSLLGHCIINWPRFPSAYIQMAATFLSEGKWDQAIDYCHEARMHRDNMHDECVFNPAQLEGAPHAMLAYAYGKSGKLDLALEHADLAEIAQGRTQEITTIREELLSIKARKVLLDGFSALARQHEDEGRPELIRELAKIAPEIIRNSPLVRQFLPKVRPDHKPVLAIVCPGQWEFWGPSSLETGIGGSETAVIQLSREMVKQGWHVEVYAHTKEEGEHDGVQWYPSYAYNSEMVDCVMWWRAPNAPMLSGMNAWVSWVWLHDIPNRLQWIKDFDLLHDHVMVLSQYHRELYSFVPDEMIFRSRNALSPEDLVEPGDVQPGKIVYSSCPSRGLVHLLRRWGFIRDRCKHAELHCFYGWNPIALARTKVDKPFEGVYNEVERLRKQDGIHWHGRVGKKELYEAYATAQIWSYSTMFPEISCITGMEAQCHGAMPLVNDTAALKETVQFGLKTSFDFAKKPEEGRYANLLLQHLKNPGLFSEEKRREMIRCSRERFQWKGVAEELSEALRQDLERAQSRGERRTLSPGTLPSRPSVLTAT